MIASPAHLRRPGLRSRRGLTLLETVLAVLLLTLVTTAIMSAVSFVLSSEGRARKRLAASEVANRLLLQYLDNRHDMPDRSLPIDYGEYRFAWDLDVADVSMELNSAAQRSKGTAGDAALSRFRMLQVTVLDAESSASGSVIRGEQLATLSRVYDPFAARNPDRMERTGLRDLEDLLRNFPGGPR